VDDLWEAASGDHEHFAREAALARAEAEMDSLMPFLLASRSPEEFGHRLATANSSVMLIAARAGVEADDIEATARRRYELYREALAEGEDPLISLEPLLNGGGYGQGPEEPLEHDEGPDFSHGYSEVPMGNLSGPDPAVTQPRQEAAAPVSQATGSLRRQASDDPGASMMSPYTPPDAGLGNGSVDVGLPTPDSNSMSPSVSAGPQPGGNTAPVGQATGRPGVTTGSLDPVRSKILRVTAMIAEANPGLPAAECERLGRKVVSRYLRAADLNDSAIGNGPMGGGGGGGSGSGGGGGGAAAHVLEGQGIRSMIMPGLGGGEGGGGASGAAGGLGDIADVAELAAL
jgi:hypothetical protein